MWHVSLLDAHCPTCASCSFPNRAGKGGESATHTGAIALAFRNRGKEQRRNLKQPSTKRLITMSASCFLCDEGWSPLPEKVHILFSWTAKHKTCPDILTSSLRSEELKTRIFVALTCEQLKHGQHSSSKAIILKIVCGKAPNKINIFYL